MVRRIPWALAWLLALACVLAMLVFVVWIYPDRQESTSIAKPLDAQQAPSSALATVAPAVFNERERRPHTQTLPSRQLRPRVTETADAYYAATDLAKITAAAADRPEEGSYFYALLAYHECHYMGAQEATDHVDASLKALASTARRQHERCKSLAFMPPDIERDLARRGVAAGDRNLELLPPTVLTRQGFTAAQLQHALLNGDPGVAEVATHELAVKSAGVVTFDGQPLTPIEQSAYPVAMLLVACDLGVPCDQTHWLVKAACIGFQHCFGSLDELVQKHGHFVQRVFNSYDRYSHEEALRMVERFRHTGLPVIEFR